MDYLDFYRKSEPILLHTRTPTSLTYKCHKCKLTKCMGNKTLDFSYWHFSQDFILKASKQGICCFQNIETAVLWHHLRPTWLQLARQSSFFGEGLGRSAFKSPRTENNCQVASIWGIVLDLKIIVLTFVFLCDKI